MPDDEALDLSEAMEIFNDGVYRAVLLDVEPFYRWFIFRKEDMLQEGVSISEAAGRRAVSSILVYFRKVDHKIDSYQSGRGQVAEAEELVDGEEDDGLTDLFDRKLWREEE
jgi:soluble methane monooxygenase-binding protein MmoD